MAKLFDLKGEPANAPFPQWLNLHIGPSSANKLDSEQAFEARRDDVRHRLLTTNGDRQPRFLDLLEQALGQELAYSRKVVVDIDLGGQRGIMCPSLTVHAYYGQLVGVLNAPEKIRVLCRLLADALDAEWVVANYLGCFYKFKVEFDKLPTNECV